jgi:hypothetical protein
MEYVATLEKTLSVYFLDKAPALPENVKLFIVKYGPWITLVLLILSLPVVLALFGLSAFLLPLSFLGGIGNGLNYTIAIIFLAITIVLEALAIPGLLKRKLSAWHLIFYAALLNALYHLFTFDIFGLIIGTAISLYILFQIRSYYK